MSNFQAIGILIVTAFANTLIYFTIARWTQERSDAIVSGVMRGVPLSDEHRLIILQDSWIPLVAGLIGFEMIMTISVVIVGRNVESQEVQLFAYLCALLIFVSAVLGGLVQAIFSYHRLRGMLRKRD